MEKRENVIHQFCPACELCPHGIKLAPQVELRRECHDPCVRVVVNQGVVKVKHKEGPST